MAKKDVMEPSSGTLARGDLFSSPLSELHREVDRLFDEFMGGFRPWRSQVGFRSDGSGALVPMVDVSETDKEVTVTADLPGIDEKDIDVTLSDGVLTIRGERKAKKKEKEEKKSCHRIERSHGMYSRSIALPAEVDENRAKADFAKCVLTVRLPKTVQARSKAKKISIKAA